MYIRSTGLGKTLLQCRVKSVECSAKMPQTLEDAPPGANEPERILLTMEVISPVSWTVRAFVEPADLRQLVLKVLKNPVLLIKALKFVFIGGDSPSLKISR